jgi:hypothetical protein
MPSPVAGKFQHYIRLGTHAEKEYLTKAKPLFDGLALNANLVEATRSALAVFAITLGKQFVVDPVTYAFALDPVLLRSTSKKPSPQRPVRATFKALADQYMLPSKDHLGKRPLTPKEFDETTLATFVDHVLKYQTTRLASALAENADFLTSEVTASGTVLSPALPMAPYFVDDFSGEWRKTNMDCLRIAHELGGPVQGMVAFDNRLATPASLWQLVSEYLQSPLKQFWIWPTDLDEHYTPEPSLKGYADAVARLSGEKTVIAAYGGFFAILLYFRGLAGVCHGVGYGDKRNLEPVLGGGIPPARFYLRAIRDTIAIGDLPVVAAGLTDDDFRKLVCSCQICAGLLERGGVANLLAELTATEFRQSPARGVVEVPTGRVYRLTRNHFLLNRHTEIREVTTAASFQQLAESILNQAQWAAHRLSLTSTRHINNWLKAADPA